MVEQLWCQMIYIKFTHFLDQVAEHFNILRCSIYKTSELTVCAYIKARNSDHSGKLTLENTIYPSI